MVLKETLNKKSERFERQGKKIIEGVDRKLSNSNRKGKFWNKE